MPIDRPKHRPSLDAGGGQPSVEGGDWACSSPGKRNSDPAPAADLIGLAAPDRDDDPLCYPFDIRAINCNEFGATEGAGKPDKEQCSISMLSQGVAQPGDHRQDVLSNRSRNPPLWAPVSAAYATHRQPNEIRLCGRSNAVHGMGFPDRHQSARQGCHRQASGMVREILRDGPRGCRHRPAPGLEMAQIRFVGSLGVFGEGGEYVIGDIGWESDHFRPLRLCRQDNL